MPRPYRPHLYWAVTLGATIVLGLAAGVGSALSGPVVAGALATAACAAGMGVAAWKWRRLDEAAREAHKSAWFWGASWSLCLVGGAWIWLIRGGRHLDLAGLVGQSPAELVALGIAFCIGLQLIGYALFWAGWWLSKR